MSKKYLSVRIIIFREHFIGPNFQAKISSTVGAFRIRKRIQKCKGKLCKTSRYHHCLKE